MNHPGAKAMKTMPLVIFFVALSVFFTTVSKAQSHAHHQSKPPVELGQSTFAAIGEIVEILMADPETDWTKVDIPALRSHLIDMYEVTVNAEVSTTVEGRRVTFHATGSGRTVQSIQTMLVAHAGSTDIPEGWALSATVVLDGGELAVTTTELGDAKVVTALGLIGVLTLGSHHQQHHLRMVTGQYHH